jgi:hypothetical protein
MRNLFKSFGSFMIVAALLGLAASGVLAQE